MKQIATTIDSHQSKQVTEVRVLVNVSFRGKACGGYLAILHLLSFVDVNVDVMIMVVVGGRKQ